MKVRFTIPGDPVAKGRPRFTRFGKPYPADKTVRFENLVTLAYREACPDRIPFDGAVTLSVDAYFSVPKSWPNKKRLAALDNILRKTTKPDLDNVVKSVSDGLNKVAWVDDAQVCELHSWKGFSENPRTEVEIDFKEESE